MSEKLGWGILGTGNIAKTFATGVSRSESGRLAAVGSRTQPSANAFGDAYGIDQAHRHASYEALLADLTVQAVYIATPHPLHAQWAIRAADAGKHLLVEKPIALNAAEAMAIIEATVANDVFLMEAFMYRCHPQTAKVVELIKNGAIGEVRAIQATFSFHWPKPWNGESRLTSNALAGGGILDVGCYPVSFSRLIAGVALGKPFADPSEVKGVGHLGPTGTDEYAAAVLRFERDIIAEVATGVQLQQDNVARVYGSDGSILIPAPWVPAKEGGSTKIVLTRAGAKSPEEITIESPQHLYAIEADTVARFLKDAKRQASSPAMSWDDSLGNMRTLDAWRAQIGLVYDAEKPQSAPPPLASSRKKSPTMKYGSIAGVNKKLSRLVMGCDNQMTFPHAAAMFDDFVARGGTVFDTAWVYGGGLQERLLGQWINARKIRDEVAVIVKGAHSPLCTPRDLTRQLKESLDRLGTDHADLYIMHRDNPEISVGEFVDVLNEHKSSGLIRGEFGGSNWTLARVQAANDYAAKNGKIGFGTVSNNFSLARMVDPVWAGCIAASDPESRAWFTRTQIPLLAWSSQARGFFLPGRAAPDKKEDKELVRCWYSDDNFQRLARVNELAKKLNVLPINIALAYVLAQPFPTFALIGPRQLSETRTSLAALEVELSSEQVKWLNLEA